MHLRKVITFAHGPETRKLQVWDFNLGYLTIKPTLLISISSEAGTIRYWIGMFVIETIAIV